MSKFYLIRHSITKGNLEKRYIGAKTDEPLCKAGYELLKEKHYPKVEKVIASPMKRCIETAQLLFPDTQIQIEESLRECDFGEFENKNYQELSQSKAYQAWIDSNGTLPFPNGESQESFRKRSTTGFKRCIEQCLKEESICCAWRHNYECFKFPCDKRKRLFLLASQKCRGIFS